MVTALRGLAEPAPRSLSAGVMAKVGLADSYTQIPGPIGPLLVAWGPDGITLVERAGDEMGFEMTYSLQFGRPVTRVEANAGAPPPPGRWPPRRREGGRPSRRPWPPDRVRARRAPQDHGDPAWRGSPVRLGCPRDRPAASGPSGRFGTGQQPDSVRHPCHRVVRTDGHIGEYGAGGPEAKTEVLAVEGVDAAELERLASAGIRYFGSDTTKIFCFPSCRHARRTMPKHLVRFRSADDAHTSGYRACKVCRPLEASPFAA